jgi:hypothetical protein
MRGRRNYPELKEVAGLWQWTALSWAVFDGGSWDVDELLDMEKCGL